MMSCSRFVRLFKSTKRVAISSQKDNEAARRESRCIKKNKATLSIIKQVECLRT